LTHLVTDKNVSGSTQSQALNAIVFLYKQVLNIDLGELDYLRNIRRFKNLLTVLSQAEASLTLLAFPFTLILLLGLPLKRVSLHWYYQLLEGL